MYPRANMHDLFELVHDSQISGHFSSNKTLASLEKDYWEGKLCDIYNYFSRFLTCQICNNVWAKLLDVPQSVEFADRKFALSFSRLCHSLFQDENWFRCNYDVG